MRLHEVLEALEDTSRNRLPAMLWGAAGIGKSDLVRLFSVKNNRKVFDIRLALLDPTDLRGIPFFDPETQTAKWGIPSILPVNADGPSTLFLDEINSAPPAVQAAAYQLVLDRRIGEYILPDDCTIIAAGNREGDGGVTYPMPDPLRNRFCHFEVETSADDWTVWAISIGGIHEDIVSYLNFKKDSLHTPTSDNAFRTPRTWEYANRFYTDPNCKNKFAMMTSAVGAAGITDFKAFLQYKTHLPDPASVLSGVTLKLSDEAKKSPGTQHACSISLIYHLVEMHKNGEDLKLAMNNCILFMSDSENFNPEFAISSVKFINKMVGFKIQTIPAGLAFFAKYGKYL